MRCLEDEEDDLVAGMIFKIFDTDQLSQMDSQPKYTRVFTGCLSLPVKYQPGGLRSKQGNQRESGREAEQGGDIYTHIADSCFCVAEARKTL